MLTVEKLSKSFGAKKAVDELSFCIDKPGVYLDETTMRMVKGYRVGVFASLANALILEGKNDKALAVLDKSMEVLPAENVPLDYSALGIGDMYYQIGEKEKAEQVFEGILDYSFRSLNWFYRLKPGQLASVMSTVEHNLAVIQEILRISAQHNPEFTQKYVEEFDNYRMAYGASRRQ